MSITQPERSSGDGIADDARDAGRPEARDGSVPGLTVPPGDPVALESALRSWLTDPGLRRELRASARSRRSTLTDWAHAARELESVLRRL